jgi:hypothetical protein
LSVTKSTATVYLSVPEYTDDSAFSKTPSKTLSGSRLLSIPFALQSLSTPTTAKGESVFDVGEYSLIRDSPETSA